MLPHPGLLQCLGTILLWKLVSLAICLVYWPSFLAFIVGLIANMGECGHPGDAYSCGVGVLCGMGISAVHGPQARAAVQQLTHASGPAQSAFGIPGQPPV